jgi:alanyl-tRNA synthetase
MANHTATHILNWSLREVLDPAGQQLQQKGSLVDPDKTRFDFSHSKAVEPAEIERIEALCDDQIRRNLNVETNDNKPVAERRDEDQRPPGRLRREIPRPGPRRLIGVPVADLLARPDNADWRKYSIEFCGGTHVKSTAEIEKFAIVSEEAVAKGIAASSASPATKPAKRSTPAAACSTKSPTCAKPPPPALAQALPQLQKALDSATLRVVDRAKLRESVAELQAKVKQDQKAAASQSAGEIMAKSPTCSPARRRSAPRPSSSPNSRTSQSTPSKPPPTRSSKNPAAPRSSSASAGEKATLLAAVTDDSSKERQSRRLGQSHRPHRRRGGGGPPTMAQAGGKNPAKLGEALAAARDWVIAKLIELT